MNGDVGKRKLPIWLFFRFNDAIGKRHKHMINRIREIRKAKGMTLADLGEACHPPTTAQTIGRLETGMRNLSTKWMERIGAALGVDPAVLVSSLVPEVALHLAASSTVRAHWLQYCQRRRDRSSK
jgi:transcriptional regulator with XRE-family HTH domain